MTDINALSDVERGVLEVVASTDGRVRFKRTSRSLGVQFDGSPDEVLKSLEQSGWIVIIEEGGMSFPLLSSAAVRAFKAMNETS